MEEGLCKVVKDILERKQNKFVLEFLEKQRSCENWLQVEVAKELAGIDKYKKVRMETYPDNLDIVFERDNKDQVGIEIKTNSNVARIAREFSKDIVEVYLLFVKAIKEKYSDISDELLKREDFKRLNKNKKGALREQMKVVEIKDKPLIAIGCIRIR
jgi:hypothetical protein